MEGEEDEEKWQRLPLAYNFSSWRHFSQSTNNKQQQITNHKTARATASVFFSSFVMLCIYIEQYVNVNARSKRRRGRQTNENDYPETPKMSAGRQTRSIKKPFKQFGLIRSFIVFFFSFGFHEPLVSKPTRASMETVHSPLGLASSAVPCGKKWVCV